MIAKSINTCKETYARKADDDWSSYLANKEKGQYGFPGFRSYQYESAAGVSKEGLPSERYEEFVIETHVRPHKPFKECLSLCS